MTELPAPDLCVVIPTLNEAEHLPLLLRDLAAQTGLRLEVIVADGGSGDETRAAARMAGARIASSARGRALQMNAGARTARAPYLLFLHADSRLGHTQLLADALAFLGAAERQEGHDRVAGHFALRFILPGKRNRTAWRYLEAKSRLNRPGTTNGDQGLLLPRRYFEDLGGFDTVLPFLEDQRLSARIHATGRLLTLPGSLQTSARRFERHGFCRQYVLMALIMTMHTLGLRAFFEQAAGIYRGAHESGTFRVLPFFLLGRRLLRAGGWRSYLSYWRRIGAYAGENAWQPFLLLDVILGRGERAPLLALHERLGPLWRHPATEVFAAAVLWLHLHLVLIPWLWVEDLLRA